MFVAEGSINVIDFLKSGTMVIELFATENWLQSNELITKYHNTSPVSTKDLKKISSLSSPSEVLAIFKLPENTFNNIIDTENLTIALDNISDPGNLGTIIRTADWFGIKQIFCSTNTVDAFNPKVVQATMGSLARVEVKYTKLNTLFENKPKDLPIFGALLSGKPITEIQPQKNGIILIGSEAHGISNELLPFISHKITIPSYNQNATNNLESLNASVANAIICYALCKK
jgi:TrmH family RNA methyltransferase